MLKPACARRPGRVRSRRHVAADASTSGSRPAGLLLLVLILVTVSIGGIVEITPLFTIESTIEKVEGVRPYSPLELMGRNIYIREGCYTCHSQMIRPFRDEAERYGHYSLAAESMYDHPFQWGSQADRPRSRPGRRQVLQRVAGRPPDRPAQRRAREHHAALRLPARSRPRTPTTSPPTSSPAHRGRALHRRDGSGRQGRSAGAGLGRRRPRGAC